MNQPTPTPVPSSAPTAGQPPHRGSPLGSLLAKFGPFLALLTLVIVGLSTNDAFGKPENFQNILWAMAPVGIVAIGMTFVISLGGIDLSVGSLAALVGVATITFVNSVGGSDPSAWVVAGACVLAVVLGACLGTLNGMLVALARIPPFIVTLGTMAAFKSLAQTLANDGVVSARGDLFKSVGGGGIPLLYDRLPDDSLRVALMIPWPVVVFFAMALVGQLVLRRTIFGRRVLAIGDNETASRYAAVPVRSVRLATYTLCGAMAGLGALMSASYLNSASHSQTGAMWELDAIAAVVIGGTIMSGGSGTVAGTVVGVVLLGVINNLLVMWGSPPALQGLFKGSIIVAAVLIQRGRK